MDGLKMFARVAKDHPWILDRETLRDEIITKTNGMEIHTFVCHAGKEIVSYEIIEQINEQPTVPVAESWINSIDDAIAYYSPREFDGLSAPCEKQGICKGLRMARKILTDGWSLAAK